MIVSSVERPSKNATITATNLDLKQDVMIGVGLLVLGILTRLPFVGNILYHWDSINFALGLQHFDVAAGQPHVPGYILYVFLGQLINMLSHNAQLTLTGISVVSSGLAVAALYELGRTMFSREIGLFGALLLASSPLFWFYGEIALPHSLDTFVVIVMVWLLYRVKQGQVGLAIPAAICLAIAGGLRPQTELFLAPLALYTGYQLGWRRGLVAVVTLVVFSLAWLIPLFWFSGGAARYFEIMQAFTAEFNTTTSVFSGGLFGLTRNLTKLTLYTLYGWGLGLIPVLAVVALKAKRVIPQVLRASLKDVRFWFMILWIFPTVAYYVFIHMGQQGLVFVFLPALLLLSAGALSLFNWSKPIYRHAVLVGLVVVNALIFITVPTYPLGSNERVKLLTAETLHLHDTYYMSRLEALPQNFPETQTLLLSSSWRFPQYYLPNYLMAPFGIVARWELREGSSTRTGEIWVDGTTAGLTPDSNGYFYVVLFDNDLIPFNHSQDQQQWLELPDGKKLAYLRFTSAERLYIGPQFFEIVPAP